jgi:hypothetical protein
MTMKVSEVIAKLQTLNQDSLVHTLHKGTIHGVQVVKNLNGEIYVTDNHLYMVDTVVIETY